MPVANPFKVSLIDSSLVPPAPALVLSADCTLIAITDNSNYSITDQVGYTPAAKFSNYRKVIITHQSGQVFIMSSIAGADQLITPASSLVNLFTYQYGFGDGVYAFNLISIPTWNSSDNYQNSTPQYGVDVVYNVADGLLYKNKVAVGGTNQNKQPNLQHNYWAVTNDADLSEQFSTTERISIFCAANTCWMNKLVTANCGIMADNCDPNMICNNKDFLNSLKIRNLIDGIIWASEKGDFDSAATYFDTITTICQC